MGKENKGMNRRDVLRGLVTGAAAAGLSGLAGGTAAALGTNPAPRAGASATAAKVLKRTLGRTGISLPVVGMGVMNADLPPLIRRSYEAGVRFFDTAAYYQAGKNEEMVGTVIKDLGVRDQVTLATKIMVPQQRRGLSPEQAGAAFDKALDGCLSRLKMDRVDILYLHVVDDPEDLRQPWLREAMARAKKSGKTRFTGFTTHSNMRACIEEATRHDFCEVILTTFNYSLCGDEKYAAALKAAAAKGIGLVAMKTQCQQAWYRENMPPELKTYYEGPIMHTALLKWVLRHEFITAAVPGYTTFAQMEADVSVLPTLDYTPDEKKFMEDRKVRLALGGVCVQCGACREACPRNADVPSLLRVHMYAASYANFRHARAVFDDIEPGRGIRNCAACETCVARCARAVDIPRRIDELKAIYA